MLGCPTASARGDDECCFEDEYEQSARAAALR